MVSIFLFTLFFLSFLKIILNFSIFVGVSVIVEDETSPSCFRSRETEQRSMTRVFGKALGGGVTAIDHVVNVRALDGFGQPVNVGGDELRAVLHGPDTLEPAIADLGNGSYTVRYNPDTGGYYDLSIRLEGELAARLPERISLQAASFCPLRGDQVLSAPPLFASSPPTTCSQYNENSCCLTQGDYADVARAQRDFAAAYRGNAQCAEFFDIAACGVYCSPAQATVEFLSFISS